MCETSGPLNLLVGGRLTILFSLPIHSRDSCRGTPAPAPGAQCCQLRQLSFLLATCCPFCPASVLRRPCWHPARFSVSVDLTLGSGSAFLAFPITPS